MNQYLPQMIVLAAFGALSPFVAMGQEDETKFKMREAGALTKVYKTTSDSDGNAVALNAHLFYPPEHRASDRRPAIVFFFGGGWKNGSPKQFIEHCRYLASRGMVAITADYRVLSRQGTKAVKCVADGKSAVRWIRRNAAQLGVDAARVAAGGGSAGGHVAACTGVIDGFDEPGEDLTISSRPDALVLFNPAVVLAQIDDRPPLDESKLAELPERMGTNPRDLSPVQHVTKGAPPTILFHGRDDKTVPYWTVESFRDAMVAAGNRCELIGFDGEGHGFFNYGRGDNSSYQKTIRDLDQFLTSLGYLEKR